MKISVEASFNWTKRFASREWPLLVPVALAFFALPPLAIELLLPAGARRVFTAPPTNDVAAFSAALSWLAPIALVVGLCGLVGGLAILALALRPGTSVREAIGLGVRRAPAALGLILMVMGVLLVSAITFAIVVQAAGAGGAAQQSMLMFGLTGAMLWATIRLSPALALVVVRELGPIRALAAGWTLGRGQFWRMFGAIMLYMVGAVVLVLAIRAGAGLVLILATRGAGLPEAGYALQAVLMRSVAALVNTGLYLLIASFYRQLASNSGT